jgi:phosphatidylglycerophosphate synthase
MAVVLVLVVVLGSMLVFARRDHVPDPDVARRPASVLLGQWVRHWMVWALGPLERLLLRLGVSPDLLNALGLVGGIAGGLAFARGELQLAAWLVAAGGFCDILDGRIARARGMASASGAFIDSTLDRFAEAATLAGVAWYFRQSDALMLWTFIALSGSMLVSYTRARGEALGARDVGGLMQRPERVTLLVIGAAVDASWTSRLTWAPGAVLGAAVVLIGAGSLVTAIYRAAVIIRRLRQDERRH